MAERLRAVCLGFRRRRRSLVGSFVRELWLWVGGGGLQGTVELVRHDGFVLVGRR